MTPDETSEDPYAALQPVQVEAARVLAQGIPLDQAAALISQPESVVRAWMDSEAFRSVFRVESASRLDCVERSIEYCGQLGFSKIAELTQEWEGDPAVARIQLAAARTAAEMYFKLLAYRQATQDAGAPDVRITVFEATPPPGHSAAAPDGGTDGSAGSE